MNERLTKEELIGILGPITDSKKDEVAAFCIENSSHEDFESAWKLSRELLKDDPYYYQDI